MPCTNCMVDFTPFRREHGCSSCSFSFCARCLPQKIVLPQLSKQPVSVCQNCYDKLAQKVRDAKNHSAGPSPPAYSAYQKNDRLLLTNSMIDGVPAPRAQVSVSRTQPSWEDEEIKLRLEELKKPGFLEPTILSVTEIEERLAKLRGVSVEEIRSPSLMFTKGRIEYRKENAKLLIEKAKEEAAIEKKWDPVQRLQDRYNDYYGIPKQKDDEKMQKISLDEKEADFDSDLFGEGTVKNLEELNKVIADYKAALNKPDEQVKLEDEMKEILKITRQKSQKTETINAEMAKFWRRISKDSSEDESGSAVETNDGIDEEELKEILVEAEKAVAEENRVVKEAKKLQKRSFFSKLFRSADT